jgi:Sigma-70, region 4
MIVQDGDHPHLIRRPGTGPRHVDLGACTVVLRIRRPSGGPTFGRVAGYPLRLFERPEDIADALCAMPSYYAPSSTSLMRIQRRSRRPSAEPFQPGFLATIGVRAELARMFRALDDRSRRLLVLWFIEDRPVSAIAERLGVSRVHCYRLRDKALRAMLDDHLERVKAAGIVTRALDR